MTETTMPANPETSGAESAPSDDQAPRELRFSIGLPRIKQHRQSTAEMVARELMRHVIHSEHIRAGDRLPSERELAEAFGVGRAAVREALKSLSILGVLDIRPGSGAYLIPPNSEILSNTFEIGLLLGEQSVDEIVEIRTLLEVAIARLAAERRDGTDIDELETIVRKMSVIDTPDEFTELDIAFHLRLAACTRNRTLVDLLTSVQSLLRVWIIRITTAQTGDFVAPHREVLEAVRAGNPDAAERAMRSHMLDARDRLQATLPRE